MKWKKGAGKFFLTSGLILIAAEIFPMLTGAIIGGGFFSGLFVIGFFSSILGLILIFAARLEEKLMDPIVDAPAFFARIYETGHESGNHVCYVLDTSVIIPYTAEELRTQLQDKKHGHIFVPESVLEELRVKNNRELVQVLEENTEDLEGEDYEGYRTQARKYLENSGKMRIKRELLPYLNGTKKIEGHEKEIEELAAPIRRRILENAGLDDKSIDRVPEYALSEVKKYLEKVKVGEGDVDVLATALYAANQGYWVVMGEKDLDLREAVELIKQGKPKIGEKMTTVEPYRNQYHPTMRLPEKGQGNLEIMAGSQGSPVKIR